MTSLWVFHERAKAREAFIEREHSLLETITSLKADLSKTKAQGLALEEKIEELSETLDRRSRQVDEISAKYAVLLNDKKILEQQILRGREEKRTLEEKVKRLYASPFLAKLLTEKKGFESDVEGLKETIEESRNELVEITEERNSLETRLEEIQTAKVKLEEKLRQEKGKIDAMSKSLEKEKADRLSVAESLSENFSRVKREKEILQLELSRVSQEKIGMEQELDQVRDRLQEINQKRDDLATQVKEINQVLETRLQEINQIRSVYEKTIDETRQIVKVEKDVVELPPIVVKGESSVQKAIIEKPTHEAIPTTASFSSVKNGKVVGVNVQHQFIVINLGKEDGVHEGMSFHVYRDGEDMALVKATEVRQKISACDIVSSDATVVLREGDLVIY